MTSSRWKAGDRVVRREFLHGHAWIGFTTYVVRDEPDLLAVYLPSGAELAFPDWPFEEWEHPWQTAGHTQWSGHGKLMLHRPGDAYSVDLFWRGDHREFTGWYVNLQDPFRRHGAGFDTLDHELDYWVGPDRTWTEKDDDLFEQRVREGRYSREQAASIREVGASVRGMLTRGEQWWDPAWAHWHPPQAWSATTLPSGWDAVAADDDPRDATPRPVTPRQPTSQQSPSIPGPMSDPSRGRQVDAGVSAPSMEVPATDALGGVSAAAGVAGWRLERESPVYSGWVRVVRRTFRSPDGRLSDWDVIDGSRTVAVVARTVDGDFLTVRQFRQGPMVHLDELPGGYIRADEDPGHAAVRELREETGYEAASLVVVGGSWMAANAAVRRFFVLVEGCRRVGDPQFGREESGEVRVVPPADFVALARSGDLTDQGAALRVLDHLGLLS